MKIRMYTVFRDEETLRTPLSPAEAARLVFDYRDAREKEKYLPTSEFLPTVQALLQTRDAPLFRKLCLTAISSGIVSSQKLEAAVGDVVPRNLKKLQTNWALPNPVTVTNILNFFATIDPEEIKKAAGKGFTSDNKLPWRHSLCAPPAAEPTPQG